LARHKARAYQVDLGAKAHAVCAVLLRSEPAIRPQAAQVNVTFRD